MFNLNTQIYRGFWGKGNICGKSAGGGGHKEETPLVKTEQTALSEGEIK